VDPNNVKSSIHNKVVEIAKGLGKDARKLGSDEVIPSTGLLDSAGLMELMMWFEVTYSLTIDQADMTIDNLGSIDSMAAYLASHRGLDH
jgi:acyl carrier protein